ncbi:hypothetical protein [Streptosporangium sp. NPDC048865]|uniref:hypothetical protein n=1 Tax=Streptosporangium sp. NPDC048865 TaxID=3155766 RepID=UPI0034174424
MISTGIGPPVRLAQSVASGPLLGRWGTVASPDALIDVLAHPDRALSLPSLRGESSLRALERVRERAEAERGSPWAQPLATQYARYFQDGDRTVYEGGVFARQERLTRAVLMAAATESDEWLTEAADGIVLVCEQSSWCWPAHEEFCRSRGTVLPDPAVPCLDLGAGGVAAQLAWADHMLGERLDERFPGLRDRLRAEVRWRVLEPFTRRRDWHWLGLDGRVHNWCPWICGNVLVAALRLAEPGAERALQVALAIEGVDRHLAALPGDGSVDEGYEYRWNGAYPVEGLERWWRTARLDREAGSVTIEDSWTFTDAGPPSEVRFLLAGQVRQEAPGRVMVRPPGGGRAAVLSWDPERAVGTLAERELDDPVLVAVWGERLTRLRLELPGTASGSVLVRMEVRP